jgi:hypothetical protein
MSLHGEVMPSFVQLVNIPPYGNECWGLLVGIGCFGLQLEEEIVGKTVLPEAIADCELVDGQVGGER